MGQLDLEGRDVGVPPSASSSHPLTAVQRVILRMAAREGEIRTVEAGVIVHRMRGHCGGMGARWANFSGTGLGCCPYAAPDGLEALKRLAARGLLERGEKRGTWRPL